MNKGKENSFEWDPTEPVAARPLFMQQRNPSGNPSNCFFTHDGNKNVSDIVSYQLARGKFERGGIDREGDESFGW